MLKGGRIHYVIGGIVADHVTGQTITEADHWLVQEQTGEALKALMNFFVEE